MDDGVTIHINRALAATLASLASQIEEQPDGSAREYALLANVETLAPVLVDLLEDGTEVKGHFHTYRREGETLWMYGELFDTELTQIISQMLKSGGRSLPGEARSIKACAIQFLRDVPELLVEFGYWKLLLPEPNPV